MCYEKKKLSPILLCLLGLVVSAMLGMLLSLSVKPEHLSIVTLGKITIVYLDIFTMAYAFYSINTHNPVFITFLKYLGLNIFFSVPYFTVLIINGTSSLKDVLIILPTQIILVAIVFVWYVAYQFDPELRKSRYAIITKAFFIVIVTTFIATFINLSIFTTLSESTIPVSFGGLSVLVYFLLLLYRANKKRLNSLPEPIGKK